MEKDITITPNLAELELQFEYVNSLIEQHRSSAIAKVNIEALLTNWEVGQYISQQLKSAHWGAKVVSELADYLKRMNPKRRGFGKRHLYNMVKFYDTYSTDEFNQLGKLLRLDEFVQLPIAQTEVGEIAQSVPTQLPLNEIVQSPIAQLDTPLINMPRLLALATFTSHKLKNVPSMFHQNLMLRKCKSPVISLITGLLLRVPGRTRTVDIQNHNLTL